MSSILACIDTSAYATAVCDHALWFADRSGSAIEVLHVDETARAEKRTKFGFWPQSADTPADHAVQRLIDGGAEDVTALGARGGFAEFVAAESGGADLLIMGKRGENSDQRRRTLGANVDRILRQVPGPVCVVSNLFLPINRVLVLIDDDPNHRRSVEFVAAAPYLSGLDIDLAMMRDEGAGAEVKLSWAREMLGPLDVDIYPVSSRSADEAAARYLEKRGSDLLILSREVLFADPAARVARVEAESLWRWRMPVLIC